jgi:hypothetical protein
VIPQIRTQKLEQNSKPAEVESLTVTPVPAQDNPKAPLPSHSKIEVPSKEFKIDPLKQQLKDRKAHQILKAELAKAKKDLRKLKQDVANGSLGAEESAKRVQSDIEAIKRELKHRGFSEDTSAETLVEQ